MCVINLPRVALDSGAAGMWITSPSPTTYATEPQKYTQQAETLGCPHSIFWGGLSLGPLRDQRQWTGGGLSRVVGTCCGAHGSFPLSPSNGHFPGGPGLAGTRMSPFWILLELRMMELVVTTGAVRCAKLQSNWHHQQTNTQLLTGRMPFLSPNQQCQTLKSRSTGSLLVHNTYDVRHPHHPAFSDAGRLYITQHTGKHQLCIIW